MYFLLRIENFLYWQARPDLIPALQAASITGGSRSSGSSTNKSLNGAIETLPRGRGTDERAARAAAEVRKKAAARGLLVRPHNAPVQTLPPLTQLLNIINSGVTPGGVENREDAGAVKKEDNDLPCSDSTNAKTDPSLPVEEQAPVGLGKGLASLDTKKQSSELKVGA